MPLVVQVSVVSASPTAIVVQDSTGNYDSVSNPGGWGTPNPDKVSVTGTLLSTTPLSLPEVIPTRLSTDDQVSYLYQGGVNAPIPGNLKDGVYTINARVGFAGPTVISAIAGSYQFLMTDANTTFAEGIADGFTVDGINPDIYYQIDRTKPLTSSGGYVILPLPAISNQASTVYSLCYVMALVYQQGENCLLKDIANYAGTGQCCEGEDLYDLTNRYAEYLGMLQKFNNDEDFAGANFIAMKLQHDCRTGETPCYTQGTQPNVPFVGNGPAIITQPVNQNTSIGAEVAFSVVAAGTSPLSYQWYKNGVLIPGQAGSTLTLDDVQPTDAAQYYVVVSNPYSSIQSDVVTLTVGSSTVPVSITEQPTNQNGQIGGSVTFTLQATGTGPITYQWYKSGSPISGATSNSLVLTNIQSGDLVSYYCIVTGPSNNVQSSTVQIIQGVTVGWGWTANSVPNSTDITDAQGTGTIPSGNPLIADFRANTSPMILFAFEPSSEPAKTQWWGSVTNNGAIGDPNNDLFVTTTITVNSITYRVYYTVFATQQTQTTIQFLTSSQTPS